MLKHIFINTFFILVMSASSFSFAQTLDKKTAINYALQNNPNFRAAISQIKSMEGKRIQADLRPNPEAVFELENFAGTNDKEGFFKVQYVVPGETGEKQQKISKKHVLKYYLQENIDD